MHEVVLSPKFWLDWSRERNFVYKALALGKLVL